MFSNPIIVGERVCEIKFFDFESSSLFVKEDGTLCIWIDDHKFNKRTVKNKYRLPHLDNLFDLLQGASYLSNWPPFELSTVEGEGEEDVHRLPSRRVMGITSS